MQTNETVFFETINDKRIFCYFSEPPSSKKVLIIMSHGFRGSSTGPARQFVDFQRLLNREGYAVLRFDQPNSGNSDGDYLETSYNEWVASIVFLAEKYMSGGYQIVLMGQSMGAAATVVASVREELKGKIPCILLWVPGVNDGNFEGGREEVFEEDGQKYKGKFWQEARDAHFHQCLERYQGGIHLVFGEKDRYIPQDRIDEVIRIVKRKDQPVMVLEGQDHSPWEYDVAQEVFRAEIEKLKTYFH